MLSEAYQTLGPNPVATFARESLAGAGEERRSPKQPSAMGRSQPGGAISVDGTISVDGAISAGKAGR